MSTTPLAGLRNLFSALLPSASSTSFTLPVLPTPDAVEFHLSPPGSPVQLSGAGVGSGRGREGARVGGRDEGSAPSTADLLAPSAGGSLRTAQLERVAKKTSRRVVFGSRAGGESSAWKACGVEERRRCRA
ncbi:hypothetical protein RTBOTA2_006911 [Rhodotorula toruloides]|uniref:Uncharacterized protein n=1 Tax=Rhodotorula toruloides TaxID=5286 RepID=A0A0K3CCT9_RHOTO|nr:hypothetical protein RTBOTA2_006911 [Rhodotorula toruloides]